MSYAFSESAVVEVMGAPAEVFELLDDHARLGGHMEKPSAMMMGARMVYEFDARQGRAVGAVIRMNGGFLGLKLFVNEVVTERTPPTRKVWATQGEQKLVVMEAYRMGFEIAPLASGSRLRVFIDYSLPATWLGRLIGLVLAPAYARWCVRRMALDARARFARPEAGAPRLGSGLRP